MSFSWEYFGINAVEVEVARDKQGPAIPAWAVVPATNVSI